MYQLFYSNNYSGFVGRKPTTAEVMSAVCISAREGSNFSVKRFKKASRKYSQPL